MIQTDVLVIGSGVAGATAALELARNPRRQVTVITRAGSAHESNTRYAQGGIVGRGPGDSADLLAADILAAGAGATLPAAARLLAEEGPALLQHLLVDTSGVDFDRDADGQIAWGQEAAHCRRRILHVADGTGLAIIKGLLAALSRCPNVTLVTDATAVDLITSPHHSRDPLSSYRPIACYGAYVLDQPGRVVRRYLAAATVLATGGLGRIYSNTTNPSGARGDGLAMAHRAGARIINAEYVQFHPTALATPSETGFLISEAVRGEGGQLLTPDGRPFMATYAPQARDLAPRDVVARAINHEMTVHGYSHVLLDICSHMPADTIRNRFPNIYATCLKAGIDMTCEPIPVVPAAHYFCGGVWVDEWARSTVDGLYAAGEVSCTGLHGANRLASTSLLEGLVWGHRAAEDIEHRLGDRSLPGAKGPGEAPPWEEDGLITEADPALVQGDMQTIQNIMWHYVGLVRSGERLSRAIRELRHLWNEVETFYRSTRLSDDLVGLRNAVEVGMIIAEAARHNRQSRGCHYRSDVLCAEGQPAESNLLG